MDVYLKLIDGINGQRVPVLCDANGEILNGQNRVITEVAVDEQQTATVTINIAGWIED